MYTKIGWSFRPCAILSAGSCLNPAEKSWIIRNIAHDWKCLHLLRVASVQGSDCLTYWWWTPHDSFLERFNSWTVHPHSFIAIGKSQCIHLVILMLYCKSDPKANLNPSRLEPRPSTEPATTWRDFRPRAPKKQKPGSLALEELKWGDSIPGL